MSTVPILSVYDGTRLLGDIRQRDRKRAAREAELAAERRLHEEEGDPRRESAVQAVGMLQQRFGKAELCLPQIFHCSIGRATRSLPQISPTLASVFAELLGVGGRHGW
jgi:hypothetical protein